MNKRFYVHILASDHYGTLYIGLTSNLPKRVWEHKNKVVEGFSKKYDITMLVYYEEHANFEQAFLREKRLKAWKRDWKINLIEHSNPHWHDLTETINA